MTFTVTEWAGDWISFERLIDSDDPYLERAWQSFGVLDHAAVLRVQHPPVLALGVPDP